VDEIHVRLRRRAAAKGRIDHPPAGVNGGDIAEVVGGLKNCPGRIEQRLGRYARIDLIEIHLIP
jgi:hypothetical protein